MVVPFGPRPLRELSRFRREADRWCAPARLRTRAAGHLFGAVAEHLGPCVHGPGRAGWRAVRCHSSSGLAHPCRAHHQFSGTNVYPGEVAVSCPAILGGPIPPHAPSPRRGPGTRGLRARRGRSSLRARTPSPSAGACGSPCASPSGRRPSRAQSPFRSQSPSRSPPGSDLATGSAPDPVSRGLAHPVGSHRVRGLPGRPGDHERHRAGSCGALARSAPLHRAPRQHRPYRVWTAGGPHRGGSPNLTVGPCGALAAVVSDRRGVDVSPGPPPTSCALRSRPSIWDRCRTATATGTWLKYEHLPTTGGRPQWRQAPPGSYRLTVSARGSSAAHVSVPFSIAAPAGASRAPRTVPTVPTVPSVPSAPSVPAPS